MPGDASFHRLWKHVFHLGIVSERRRVGGGHAECIKQLPGISGSKAVGDDHCVGLPGYAQVPILTWFDQYADAGVPPRAIRVEIEQGLSACELWLALKNVRRLQRV